jgi:AcrR family transcriptional regulator
MADTTDAYHHGSLPEALLLAVDEIVIAQGLENVSLREAARRAGVSHSAPAHHFGDKDGLLAAYAEQGFSMLADSLETAAIGAAGQPMIDTIKAVGAAYVHFAVEHQGYFQVMFRSGLDKSAYPELHAQSRRAFGGLMQLVEVLLQEGDDTADADVVAAYFWSIAHGLSSLWVDGSLEQVFTDQRPERIVDGVLSLPLDGRAISYTVRG